MKTDILVVGAGFAGSVIAERFASHGKSVLVIDKRPHIGGNAFDEYDSSGVLVHRYGPHIFHTNARHVEQYLSRFTEWCEYEHRVLSSVGGTLYPIPINLRTINQLYSIYLDESGVASFLENIRERREPIYPVPITENQILYQNYKKLAFFVGRLAESRYYNMDQVVAAALLPCNKCLKNN